VIWDDSWEEHLLYGRPGDVVFGKPVEGRTLHSVRTLSAETGLHPKRLRAAGTLSAAADGLAEGRTSPVRC
jgi:hypothetical protein